jgi:hypothetical protein
MRPSQTVPFAVAAANMGQNLFGPPNVKGWPGGDAWINSNRLLARKAFLDRLFRADATAGSMDASSTPEMTAAVSATAGADASQASSEAGSELARKVRFMRAMDRGLRSVHFDSEAWFDTIQSQSSTRATTAGRLLLAYAPQGEIDTRAEPLELVRQIVLDSAYQLK